MDTIPVVSHRAVKIRQSLEKLSGRISRHNNADELVRFCREFILLFLLRQELYAEGCKVVAVVAHNPSQFSDIPHVFFYTQRTQLPIEDS